nr:MAG TPA: hypothetical protein [Caudoviricetes sp.]
MRIAFAFCGVISSAVATSLPVIGVSPTKHARIASLSPSFFELRVVLRFSARTSIFASSSAA